MFLSNRLRVASALILLSASALFAPNAAMAQGAAPMPQPVQPTILAVNDPHNPIHYTAAQQRKLFALRVDFQTKELQIGNDTTMSDDQKKKTVAALAKSDFDQFNASLTPSQQAATKMQLAKANAKAKAVFEVQSKNKAIYVALEKQLVGSFSPEQKAKIKTIQDATMGQANTIKQGSAPDQTKQTQMQALQQSMNSQLQTVFTPTQRGLIAQMQALQAAEPAAEARAANSH